MSRYESRHGQLMVEARDAALIAVVAVAPLAIVIMVAFIRGYDITVIFERKNKKKKEE